MRMRPAAPFLCALLLAASGALAADPRPAPPPPTPPAQADPDVQSYDEPGLLERQHEWTLYAADGILRLERPSASPSMERRLALLGIDEVMHYPAVPEDCPAARAFLLRRLSLAADQMESTQVDDGAVVWKLYNHTFIVKTRSVTLAFDLTRTWWGQTRHDGELEAVTERIVELCDAMFVSHEHFDHRDGWVVDAFRDREKLVIEPSGIFERSESTAYELGLAGGRIEFVLLPGYQGDLPNNVTVVRTPEGLAFCHTGDLFQQNSTPTDMFEWIDRVKERHRVDVLMVNNWVMKMPRVVRGFDPAVVITGHENEVGHAIEKRKPHFLSFDRAAGLDRPAIVMTWGESYYYAGPPRAE